MGISHEFPQTPTDAPILEGPENLGWVPGIMQVIESTLTWGLIPTSTQCLALPPPRLRCPSTWRLRGFFSALPPFLVWGMSVSNLGIAPGLPPVRGGSFAGYWHCNFVFVPSCRAEVEISRLTGNRIFIHVFIPILEGYIESFPREDDYPCSCLYWKWEVPFWN